MKLIVSLLVAGISFASISGCFGKEPDAFKESGPYDPPSSPRNLAAETFGDGTVHLSWDEPSYLGDGDQVYYLVDLRMVYESPVKTKKTWDREIDLTLSPGEYRVAVKALNGVGSGSNYGNAVEVKIEGEASGQGTLVLLFFLLALASAASLLVVIRRRKR